MKREKICLHCIHIVIPFPNNPDYTDVCYCKKKESETFPSSVTCEKYKEDNITGIGGDT
jgi:hypothetical protein